MIAIQLYKCNKTNDLPIQNIVRASSSINYTSFYLTNGKKVVIARTLGNFEPILAEENHFIRPNKSHIINQEFIKNFQVVAGSGIIEMQDGYQILVSRRRLQSIKNKLKK